MPKIVDHDQYREELLDRCFDLFSEKGFENVSMRKIAAELGVSTGALYHYFPTKQSVLEGLLVLMGTRDVAEATERTSATGSFEERLRIFFNFFLDKESHFQKMLLLSIDFVRSSDGDEARKLVNQWAELYLRNMEQYLEIPKEIARLIMVVFNGLVYQARLFPENMDVPGQMSLFSEILLSYLREHRDPKNRLCRMCPFLTDQKSTITQGA